MTCAVHIHLLGAAQSPHHFGYPTVRVELDESTVGSTKLDNRVQISCGDTQELEDAARALPLDMDGRGLLAFVLDYNPPTMNQNALAYCQHVFERKTRQHCTSAHPFLDFWDHVRTQGHFDSQAYGPEWDV